MDVNHKFTGQLFCLLVFFSVSLTVSSVRADLSAKQARKAITRMAGFELTNGSVKVTSTSTTGSTTGEASALIRSVFRFQQDAQTRWRVAEVRTGPGNWEEIDLVTRALNTSIPTDECNAPDPPVREGALQPSPKQARCLLGSLLGIQVPSDALRIQEVAPFAVPLASQPSTTVIALIQVDVRLVNQGKTGWQVTELRTGRHDWIKVDTVLSALNQTKRLSAHEDMVTIARALERYRMERGSYLVSDNHAVAIDHLSPRYLHRVIRLDPWHQPYSYRGTSDRYTLTSPGPDRKEGTADDVVVTHLVP